TEHFYTCAPQILSGLGLMYTEDPRFRQNIDKAGGEGTAEFVSKAIAHYCSGK
ncbi:MAG: MerR family transcriptional regulator, partial [Ruminococcaceae bacterium]|nr:MerR family transcriptional regulator [Oscillospiraceae bacterium]